MSQMLAQMLSSIPCDTQVDRNLLCGSEGTKVERFLPNFLKAGFSLPENIIYAHRAIQVKHSNCVSLHLGFNPILVSSTLLWIRCLCFSRVSLDFLKICISISETQILHLKC